MSVVFVDLFEGLDFLYDGRGNRQDDYLIEGFHHNLGQHKSEKSAQGQKSSEGDGEEDEGIGGLSGER